MTTKLKIHYFQKKLKEQAGTDIRYMNLLACLVFAIDYFASEEGSIVNTLTIKINDGYPTKVNMTTGMCTHYEDYNFD